MNSEKYAQKRRQLLMKCRRLIMRRDLINLEISKLRNEMKAWDNYLLYGDRENKENKSGE